MVTRSSSTVEARRKAAQRVQEQIAATVQATTEAVVATMVASEEQAALQEALEAAERTFRDSVDQLVKLGKSLEQIAELTGLPLEKIRGARRSRGSRDSDSGRPASDVGVARVAVVPDGSGGSPAADGEEGLDLAAAS